jgi:hypothetical protein
MLRPIRLNPEQVGPGGLNAVPLQRVMKKPGTWPGFNWYLARLLLLPGRLLDRLRIGLRLLLRGGGGRTCGLLRLRC